MGNCVPKSNKNTSANKGLGSNDVLHVVAVVFNPAGFNSRVELYKRFASEMERQRNVVLWTIECLFPGTTRPSVTVPGNPRHIIVRGEHKVWLKENLINIAVTHLPRDWKYMAWVDADVIFECPNLAERTIRELQGHPIIQMWEHADFLGPRGEILETARSFGYYCQTPMAGIPKDRNELAKHYPHPGFAWAINRWAYDMIGGIADFSIVGNGDNHFAYAMIGRVRESIPEAAWGYVSHGYWNYLLAMQGPLLRVQQEQTNNRKRRLGPGYLQGVRIRHMWHGDWKDRGYVTRWQCLKVNGTLFDPAMHLHRRNHLLEVSPVFLRAIEQYFASRNEDSRVVMTDHRNKHVNAPELPPQRVAKGLPGPVRKGPVRPPRGRHSRPYRAASNPHRYDDEEYYYHTQNQYQHGYDGGYCHDNNNDYSHCDNTGGDYGGYSHCGNGGGGGGGGDYGGYSHCGGGGGGGDVFHASNSAYC